MNTTTIDVIVIGGGPAGSAAAISLSRLGYSVALIERSEYDTIRFGETIQPNIRKLLMELQVWDRFLADDHLPSFGIHSSWGHKDFYDNNFIFSPFGAGWHLDRVKFDAMLSTAAQQAGSLVIRGAHNLHCEDNANGKWTCDFTCHGSPRHLHAKFLVDATGRSSFIARRKGAVKITFDRLIGIASFFQYTTPGSAHKSSVHTGYTLIESAEEGWWYSADVPGSKRVLVFMTDSDIYQRARRHSRKYWMEQLNKTTHTKNAFSTDGIHGEIRSVASNTSISDKVAGTNWLAIGDAAMTFDPLSSGGIYKALESGMSAANSIHQQFSGSTPAWEFYSGLTGKKFDRYMEQRKFYYLKEKRWADSLFWQRRQLPANHLSV